MKILVTGDRNWDDVETTFKALEPFPKNTILVHGACRGADNTCAAIAEVLGFIVRPYPADWQRYGRGAGPIRNQQMIDVENKVDEPIDLCLAFHNNISGSRGTADMIKRAMKAGVAVRLVATTSTATIDNVNDFE